MAQGLHALQCDAGASVKSKLQDRLLGDDISAYEAADCCPSGYESGTKLVRLRDLEAIEIACPKDLKKKFGQAILIIKNRELTH